jgi:two-component system, LytTR family, sensor histidine kinase AlgZ
VPLTPALLPRSLRALGLSLGLWLGAALVMVLATQVDDLRRGRSTTLLLQATQLLPYFGPLVVFSAVLAVLFDRQSQLLTQPARLALAFVGALAVFVPVNAVHAALCSLWLNDKPLSGWPQQLARQPLSATWTDLMLASGAFAAQVAFTSWRQRTTREQQWRQSQSDNFRLRLQLLQGQLEPHFLFNALNSVSSLVRAGERSTALAALAQVSDLLRYALRASRARSVSLADELGFVRDYLAVQALRHGQRLQLAWSCPTEPLDDLACPPLLLQPLIENAVRHGLEAREGACTIHLRVERLAAARLRVHIDNPCDEDAELPGHGLGLAATRERLSLLYGERAQLFTEQRDGRFAVTLEWPAEELGDEPAASSGPDAIPQPPARDTPDVDRARR